MERRKRTRWTLEEEDALKRGVDKHGTGKWKTILTDHDFEDDLKSRTAVDLKDKWRNISRFSTTAVPVATVDAVAVPTVETAVVPVATVDTVAVPTVDTAAIPVATVDTVAVPTVDTAAVPVATVETTAVPVATVEGISQNCKLCGDGRLTFNDKETKEQWLQCDICKLSVHQICASLNDQENGGGQAAYTCHSCKDKDRIEKHQSSLAGAKNLPRTILSNHLEKRLFESLKMERELRAKLEAKSYNEVEGAEELAIRVVLSVDKKLEVNQQFLEIVQENYPTEFSYKSKVILLFQDIEGVDVCLFSMYVQEFGSRCQLPNQRCIFISHLDSAKYLKPNINTVNGDSLCGMVYQEILIGYLDYCKKRGFLTCYISASCPSKDCILYGLSEEQKMPKSNLLPNWYKMMLRKATNESIVVDYKFLYDHIFQFGHECMVKPTPSRLPYFGGDSWPAAPECVVNHLRQEENDKKQHEKGTTEETVARTSAQSDLSASASKERQFMQELVNIISTEKEDYIVAHLQLACAHCHLPAVSMTCWVCFECKKFSLCDGCYVANKKRRLRQCHPYSSWEVHSFQLVDNIDVPSDTKDEDKILESKLFDSRQAFLNYCQQNDYKYDSLPQAKVFSKMVLYHLHNQAASRSVTKCNMCDLNIETGKGWRCKVCPDYVVCNQCHHLHQLHNPSIPNSDVQNEEACQNEEAWEDIFFQQKDILDVLVHASQCPSLDCGLQNCGKVRGHIEHWEQCQERAVGSCVHCMIIQLHAKDCKESKCHVPSCKERVKRERGKAIAAV